MSRRSGKRREYRGRRRLQDTGCMVALGVMLLGILAAVWTGSALAQDITGTGTATLSWTVPTTREDGSDLAAGEIAGYAVFYGMESRTTTCTQTYPQSRNDQSCYDLATFIPDGGSEGGVIELTLDGPMTIYFAVATEDTGGLYSRYSNEASKLIELEMGDNPPGEPMNIEVEMFLECQTSEVGRTCTLTVT